MSKKSLILSALLLSCCILLWALSLGPGGFAADTGATVSLKSYPIVLTNLRNTVTNFGSFGTRFGSAGPSSKPGERGSPERLAVRMPFSSCEWPAGSKNLYLYDGELWVGALVSGDTAVTTGRFSGQEWIPVEGIGKRTGSAAFSDQDTYTRYDDGSLGIQISQLTFAWAGSDHIVHALQVKNAGPYDLDSAYIGFCWDFNVSSAARETPALGDLVGLDLSEDISYMYDQDGDGGRSPGYIGGKFLSRPLAGHSWWTRGQDPETDAQRYALMTGGLMSDPTVPDDYCVLHCIGPFDLPAGRSIPLLHVLAIGEGLIGLQGAVSDAKACVGQSVAAAGDSILGTGEEHVIVVSLDESKRALGHVQLAVDWEFCNLDLYVVSPDGRKIYPETALSDPWINFISGPHQKYFLIADPQTGNWEMHISYLSGPASFPYHHTVTLFDLPYDYGLLMEYFQVNWAYINFGSWITESCQVDSFEIAGVFELREGQAFDPDRDPVFVRMGPYTEIIPESSFVQCPEKITCYEYFGSAPGIIHMLLEFSGDGKGTTGWFDIYGGQVDMSEAELLTLVRLTFGQNSGFQKVLLEDHGDEWWWYAGEKEGRARARTAVSANPLPDEFSLNQNYPNPFNASTTIDYHLAQGAVVQLALYNVRGQRVAILTDGQQPAGAHRVIWDGNDSHGRPVGSGIYFCHLRAGDFTQTRKMILLR